MDKVLIEGLELRAKVGVPEWERRKRQKLRVDLELELDLRKAGRMDQVEATVDYAAVAARVKQAVESRSFRLVEAVAETAAAEILDGFPVKQVTVRVRKFSVPAARSVGVVILRRRSSS